MEYVKLIHERTGVQEGSSDCLGTQGSRAIEPRTLRMRRLTGCQLPQIPRAQTRPLKATRHASRSSLSFGSEPVPAASVSNIVTASCQARRR